MTFQAFLTKLVINWNKNNIVIGCRWCSPFSNRSQRTSSIRRNRRRYRLKATISVADLSQAQKDFLHHIRFLIACFIPFVASLFLWTVDVESDIPEVVERIEKKLEKGSIVLLRPLSLIPDEGEIRRELMLDDPSLSWVRFRRVGTSLTVIPMLSPAH